ncbi:hypothetical protein H072_3399 [Dactylellina haptotyla CBS 200.50]|uniref:CP-type G domain-containing protein n=1 Tax=Dactylellina haptotyla (strain CBS 200.50) TaxID=1284197 RepID=S8AN74_DACHA|nr:hypothetical protein H072_3399 [Dactylellina haptotyla CBS 200.50]
MGLPKAKNMEGLGRTLMNDKFGGASRGGRGGSRGGGSKNRRKNGDGTERYTTTHKEADWVKMRSITEQQALDEFLATAELADTDFTAEKMNIKIIHNDQINPYLLSADEEKSKLNKHKANAGKLTVPRRPDWDESTTPAELERAEKDSFLDWRRGLAELAENNDLLLTPFERNLEVWRQLWRVIERSDLVVQIVDARNPLHFRSEDLENYVKEIDDSKKNLLLVNKADMMTLKQRQAWADYFEKEGVDYKFFSAALAKQIIEGSDDEYEDEEDDLEGLPEGPEDLEEVDSDGGVELEQQDRNVEAEDPKIDLVEATERLDLTEESEDPRTRIMTVDELESLFLSHAPSLPSDESSGDQPRRINVGLVGYPNVGKSSTINALIGAKKVSVSSTPGKTKHFQTIHLSPAVMLVDCPGLVFPNFATTKADLVCNGVLPIDQLREFTGPAGLVAQRIPKSFMEGLYGISINVRPPEEGGTGIPTASEVLIAYARARGFTKTGTGRNWDESRAARLVLKDYVNGRLLYCHPPPHDPEIDGREFNKELYDVSRLPVKRRDAILAAASSQTVEEVEFQSETASTANLSLEDEMVSLNPLEEKGTKSKNLDKQFFKAMGGGGHLKTPYRYVASGRTGAAGATVGSKNLTGRKARLVAALEKGVDPTDLKEGKQHFKQPRAKRRTNTVED